MNEFPRKTNLNLKALKTFEVCARHESFASAANELFVTQGAVSKQILKLEENIGFSLFIRDCNRNYLSPAGRELANHLEKMFEELNIVINHLDEKDRWPLVISCEPTICLKFLIPLVPEIEKDTGITTRILSGGGPVDFRKNHIDLAVRRNDFIVDEGLEILTIADEYMGPVHLPELEFSKGQKDENFMRIHTRTRPYAWRDWQKDTRHSGMKTDLYHEHHFLALEAAESAQGVAMMSLYMVARSLEVGKLIAPNGFRKDGSSYICLSRDPIELDDRKIKIIDWLQKKFQSCKKFI